MGKMWRKKKDKVFGKKERKERPKENYVEILRENLDFETFYKAQKIVPENEWEQFMCSLRKDLPAAFRLTGITAHAQALLQIIKDKFFTPLKEHNKTQHENGHFTFKQFEACQLPWYPNMHGWQLNLTRKDIRSHELYWKLHQFLISETETGNISRQEAVSMIPPLLLDVKSHHKVLDMCAAPGSKTAQIIEYLHNMEGSSEGIVIANDVNNKRCYMLTHQAKRLQSPAVVITNHDAAFMPNIRFNHKDGNVACMKFDRILCDVPCTGDGTFRKNFDIWPKWSTVNGANLHGLQLRIARRGLELLEVGGKLVYSTCSFHPLENEAVINRLLSEFGDSIVLVKESLPGLKVTPGLSHWTVMDRDVKIIESAEKIPSKYSNTFHKHLFPPTEEELKERHLDRCVRILPHHQDTGGFFIAVMTKVKPFSADKECGENASESETQRIKLPPKKRPRNCFKEEPFYYFDEQNTSWPEITSFYNFTESFDMKLFLRRAEQGKGRTIYYTNALVKNVLQSNQDKLKVINAGVKSLARCDNLGTSCKYRLCQDGLQAVINYIIGRKMNVTSDDLIKMLTSTDDSPPAISEMDEKTQQLTEQTPSGSIIYEYQNDGSVPFTINLVGWKGNNTLRVYLAKNERIHYLHLLGGDTSMYEKNKFVEQKQNEDKIDETNSIINENNYAQDPDKISVDSIEDMETNNVDADKHVLKGIE